MLKHGNYVSDDEDPDDDIFQESPIHWILKDTMQLLMKMTSMSNQGLKPQSIQKY